MDNQDITLVKLNLGCGRDIRGGFTNIDVANYPDINMQADARKLDMYLDNSVDFIVAQHLLEYIPRKHMVLSLREWYRVLKPNGELEIRVTDLALLCRNLYQNGISPEMGMAEEMVTALIYGRQSNNWDIKYNGFTAGTLQGVMYGVGFRAISNVAREDLDVIVTGVK